MRAEIIIACSGELAANLERTVANVINTTGKTDGICVVLDGEQAVSYNLPNRVRVLQPWENSRGCGAARHAGIVSSDADYVVLIDGHMKFSKGWVNKIVHHLRKHPMDITNHRMQSLTHSWGIDENDGIYNGAYLAMKCREDGNQFWALAAKWLLDQPKGGVVPALMGACYGMRHDWYVAMGQPLNLLEAWGGDEEILSVCSWMCGGRVYCLADVAWHMYAAPNVRPTTSESRKDLHRRIWGNRYAILHAIPMPEAVRSELWDWLRNNIIDQKGALEAFEKQRERAEELREHLEMANGMRWDDMVARELIGPLRPKPKHAKRNLIQADRARNLWQQPAPASVPAEPVPVNAARQTLCPLCDWPNFDGQRCKRCGHKPRNVVVSLRDQVFNNSVEYQEFRGYPKC